MCGIGRAMVLRVGTHNFPIYDECQTQQRFWPCHENGLIKIIQMITHNLYISFNSAPLYGGLRLKEAEFEEPRLAWDESMHHHMHSDKF